MNSDSLQRMRVYSQLVYYSHEPEPEIDTGYPEPIYSYEELRRQMRLKHHHEILRSTLYNYRYYYNKIVQLHHILSTLTRQKNVEFLFDELYPYLLNY